MADLWGNLEGSLRGGSDLFDEGAAGVILSADHFGNGEHGTVSGPISLTGSAGGVVYVLGAVAGTFPIAGASTGQTAIIGVVAAPLALSGASVGAISVTPVTGASDGVLAFTGSATGETRVLGAVSGSLDIIGGSTGFVAVFGAAASAVGLTGTANGVATYVFGSAAGTIELSSSSSGSVISLLRPGPAFTARYAGTVGPRRPAAAAYARHKQTQPSRNLPGLNARRTNVSRGAR